VDTYEAFRDDRTAKRAITEAGEPVRQLENKIKDEKAEKSEYETDYKDDVTEARTHASDDRIFMRSVSPILEDLNKKYIAAYTAAQTDPTQLVLVNTLGSQINQIRNDPGFAAAFDRQTLVRTYDTQMRQYDSESEIWNPKNAERHRLLMRLKINRFRLMTVWTGCKKNARTANRNLPTGSSPIR